MHWNERIYLGLLSIFSRPSKEEQASHFVGIGGCGMKGLITAYATIVLAIVLFRV
jgi:hypothetical protein